MSSPSWSASAAEVGRLAHHRDLISLAPAGSIAAATSSAISSCSAPSATSPTRSPRRPVPTSAGYTASLNARSRSAPLELVGRSALPLDVALEALLEVLGRAGDDVVAEPDPDQDPDRQSARKTAASEAAW